MLAARSYIMPKIRIPGQGTTANPSKILDAYQAFYANLYSPHMIGDDAFLHKFLDSLPIPSLSLEHKGELEAPFME